MANYEISNWIFHLEWILGHIRVVDGSDDPQLMEIINYLIQVEKNL